MAKWLTTSPELKTAGHVFADIHALEDRTFKMACSKNNVKIVQWLTTSPELKAAGHKWVCLAQRGQEGLREACLAGAKEFMQFLCESGELKRAEQPLMRFPRRIGQRL